jgi:hypothetical protein
MEMKHKRPPIDVVPTRRYLIFFWEVQNFIFSNQMILSPLHGVLHIQSACDSVAPFFFFYWLPCLLKQTFSNNRNNKKKERKKLLRTKRERNKKKVLTSGGGSG